MRGLSRVAAAARQATRSAVLDSYQAVAGVMPRCSDMRSILAFVAAAVLSTGARAQSDKDHSAHHPAAAPSAVAPSPKAPAAAQMDMQMKAMQDGPAWRSALRAAPSTELRLHLRGLRAAVECLARAVSRPTRPSGHRGSLSSGSAPPVHRLREHHVRLPAAVAHAVDTGDVPGAACDACALGHFRGTRFGEGFRRRLGTYAAATPRSIPRLLKHDVASFVLVHSRSPAGQEVHTNKKHRKTPCQHLCPNTTTERPMSCLMGQ